MKIRQIGSYTGNIVRTIVENRSVEDVETFLNPNPNDLTDGDQFYNMRLGAKVLLSHISVGSNIAILVDPDADGYTSASILYQYIMSLFPEAKLTYLLHRDKQHGLSDAIMDQLAIMEVELLLTPDAASNDARQIDLLQAMGIEILVIDHHEVEELPKQGFIINNQLERNSSTNKNLVGAGMVIKFCEVLDIMLGKEVAQTLYDLVAIGQVGDSSDISQPEVRYMVFKGLSTIQNGFMKSVLMDHFGYLENIAPKDLSFSIIPLINAVTRVGTFEEKNLLFQALTGIESERIFTVEKKKKNKDTGKFDKFQITQDLYEYVTDICKKVKSRQAALVKKTIANLEEKTDNAGGIVIGLLEADGNREITGLVANKLASKYQKPALLLFYDGSRYAGSGRGYTKILSSLKDWCNETGLVEYAKGHANAFGISINEDLFEKFKEKTKNVEQEDICYDVDLLLDGDVDKDAILMIEEYKHLFGGEFNEPLFAFTNVAVDKRFIKLKGKMMTLFHKGVEFVMWSAPDGLYESLTNNFDQYITCDFVGTPGVNTWGGKVTPRLILADMERNEPVREAVAAGTPEEKPYEMTAADLVF